MNSRGLVLFDFLARLAPAALLAAMLLAGYRRYVVYVYLPEGLMPLAIYQLQMERLYLRAETYGGRAACGIPVPAKTEYFEYACFSSGAGYIATATGTGDLSGYSYLVDSSQTPRRTIQFAGTPSDKTCWLLAGTDC